MSPCSFKIVGWRYTGCLAVIDPHRAELYRRLAYASRT
jgi:hypothetical protein